MRSTISHQVDKPEFDDVFNNHKKFISVGRNELVVEPQVGDMAAVQLKGSGGARGIYRVVTHVERLDVLVKGDGGLFLLSVRPLGKAEKEEMRA